MNNRSTALDALRGLAIIGMVLSGTISESLPAWMYHAQVGPRSGFKFDPSIYGITWVDLVFPFFLFAMGAAFPLAFSKKLNTGAGIKNLYPAIIKRSFLLVLFAIAIYHTSPYRLAGEWKYLLAVVAFILFFASFVRLSKITHKANTWLNWSGILLLSLLIAFNVISQPDVFKIGFKLSNNDIIILILANMAFFGVIAWIFTRTNLIARIGILAFFFALHLTSGSEGTWNQFVWNFNSAMFLPEAIKTSLYYSDGWLFRMDFLKYLLIVIPGTIVGDLLVKRFSDNKNIKSESPSKYKLYLVLVLMSAIVLSNLICLYSRFLIANLLLNILFGILAYFLLHVETPLRNSLYYKLYQWGISWLLLGTVFEAFEGGIRKDHATISYFFVTAGLAIFTLIFFSIIADYFGYNKIFRNISEIGQNPMVAYVAGSFLVVPILAFTGLMPHINKLYEITPWFGLLKGLIITGGMMVFTVFTVRKKWYWKT
jgi:predicted acyltransferase